MLKKITSLMLCVCVMLSVLPAAPALADENVLTISTPREFEIFAQNCRLDSYSKNLTVKLTADIDLGVIDIGPIPYFAGVFDGSGYTVKNMKLTPSGSNQGLFRYVADGAVIKNLVLQGSIKADGSSMNIGAIAGSNAGSIIGCSANITVNGKYNVGGLVGINTVSGVIDNCQVSGLVSGSHCAGGIAGHNFGVIRASQNTSRVNTLLDQNQVGMDDITLDNILKNESAATVTDIGGVTGQNSGVIKSCTNNAPVGYKQIGYNIGGIAGSQAGYITDCKNYGEIKGRKDVGGIVGQSEPAIEVRFDRDTLQILQGQLSDVTALSNSAVSKLQNTAGSMSDDIAGMQPELKAAADAIETLIPGESGSPPDPDTVTAAQNALSSALSSLQDKTDAMSQNASGSAGGLENVLSRMADRLADMGKTLQNADSNLGYRIDDVSDKDKADDTSGKTHACTNYGDVFGDLNTGGIAGGMSIENELDHEDDLLISGSASLNMKSRIRAVVSDCINKGTITANKQNGGGIVGYQGIGLAKGCINTGSLDCTNADYVGGIAGQSSAYLRQNSAKCSVSGASFVGGIAGVGSTVTGNRSLCQLYGSEKLGEVLGDRASFDSEIKNNFYLSSGSDLGGIDGITYKDVAQGLSRSAFLSLKNLPDLFKTVTITFVFANGSDEVVSLAPGEDLKDDMIPAIPAQNNAVAKWDGLNQADNKNILFDRTYKAVYTNFDTVIASKDSKNDLPILLLQGSFAPECEVVLSLIDSKSEIDRHKVISAYGYAPSGAGTVTAGRVLIPDEYQSDQVLVYADGDSGVRKVNTRTSGSYLVFDVSEGDNCVYLVKAPDHTWAMIIGIAVITAALSAVVLMWYRKKKEAVNSPEKETITV